MGEKQEKQERGERSLTRWDPFEELDPFRGWPFRDLAWPRLGRMLGETSPGAARERLTPAIDIHEDAKSYVITAEVPGCDKDDVSVEVHENVLTLHGEKKSEREERKDKARWVERSYGSFSRSFALPANAVVDRVTASFKNGVLTVQVPKSEEEKPKVISIRS